MVVVVVVIVVVDVVVVVAVVVVVVVVVNVDLDVVVDVDVDVVVVVVFVVVVVVILGRVLVVQMKLACRVEVVCKLNAGDGGIYSFNLSQAFDANMPFLRFQFLNVQVGLKVEWGASAGTMRYKEGDKIF